MKNSPNVALLGLGVYLLPLFSFLFVLLSLASSCQLNRQYIGLDAPTGAMKTFPV